MNDERFAIDCYWLCRVCGAWTYKAPKGRACSFCKQASWYEGVAVTRRMSWHEDERSDTVAH